MTAIEVQHGRDLLRRDSTYEDGMTALLYVDMQRIWCEPNLDPTHPQDADSYYHRRLREMVIPNQVRILEAGRKAGGKNQCPPVGCIDQFGAPQSQRSRLVENNMVYMRQSLERGRRQQQDARLHQSRGGCDLDRRHRERKRTGACDDQDGSRDHERAIPCKAAEEHPTQKSKERGEMDDRRIGPCHPIR